ncbi:MAG TPA: hypothetical protein VFO83_05040 [Aggregicoccus sp.]|nr:hypothetical protein [Aggregicoccus sp.]
MTNDSPVRPRLTLVDAALLLALALFCLRLLGGLEAARDLTLWDEADYLRRGLALPGHGLPALALYLCGRLAGAPRVLALLAPALFAVSAAAHVAPRPTLLALAVVLGGLALALARPTFAQALVPLGLALLLASFARPELFLSFLLVSALLALALLLRARAGAAGLALRGALTYAALSLLLVGLLGNPFSDGTGRRLYAFCQHYALGQVQRTGLALNPWGQCNEVLRRSFGEVHSVGEAARANPGAFLAHLRDNLSRYPEASLRLFVSGPSHPSVLSEEPAPWTPVRRAHALLLALAATALAGALLLRARGLGAALRAPGTRLCALALGVVLLPSALSSLLLHPREHYLVLQGVLLPLLALAWVGAAVRGAEPRVLQGAAVGLGLVLLLAAPRLAPVPKGEAPLHRRAVAQLRAHVPSSGRVALLEAQGGYDVYLGRHVTRISPARLRPGEPFERFLQRQGVGFVLLEPQLARDARLAHDAGFRAFAARPQDFGYRAQPLPGTGMTLAVREAPSRGRPAAAVGAAPSARGTPSTRSAPATLGAPALRASPQRRAARPRPAAGTAR